MVLLAGLAGFPGAFGETKAGQDPHKARAEYIARMQQQTVPSPTETAPGSLWRPDGLWNDMAADYKARRLNDIVTIVVVQQTTAQAAGNVGSQRDFNTQSGISGLPGHIKVSGVTNLLTAQSSTKLKGQGSLDASSAMKTSLAGQIVAVLPSGSMVVEAHRVVAINNQKETMIVRGVLRPNDIRPDNTAFSTALSDLEIELRGKGVVSDATRPPNPLVRGLLWLIGF